MNRGKCCLIPCALLFFYAVSTGETMKTYVFPEDLKVETIKQDMANVEHKAPDSMEFNVDDKPIYKGLSKARKLVIRGELVNHGGERELMVHPAGGGFPRGGTNPFYINFSSSTQGVVGYTGPTFPPSPPMPLKIRIPPNSRTVFYAEIPLEFFTWEGQPKVSIDWQFCYLAEPYPKGIIEVELPKK